MNITVLKDRCPQNHYCPVINVCPSQAISQKNPYSAPEIDTENCADCGVCTRFCAYGAITFKS